MRLARASCCCCQCLFGTRSSNHCGNLLRWLCSLLSNSSHLRSPVRRDPTHQRMSWIEASNPIRDTHCVHNRSLGSGLPLLNHNFDPTARSLPSPSTLVLCPDAACSNWVEIRTKKISVLLISEGSTLRCTSSTECLGHKFSQVAR